MDTEGLARGANHLRSHFSNDVVVPLQQWVAAYKAIRVRAYWAHMMACFDNPRDALRAPLQQGVAAYKAVMLSSSRAVCFLAFVPRGAAVPTMKNVCLLLTSCTFHSALSSCYGSKLT